ncbi:MAG: hypothetical protein ACE10D_00075 [Planctomycetota bacterium]|nr:hypothetical protein [Planctomycetota bacterium]
MTDRHRMRFLMGLGFDGDGHARITKGEDYVLLGGSSETHERMQDQAERFRDSLRCLGTDLQCATPEEVEAAARESGLKESR